MLGLMEFFADENILLDAKSKSFSVLYQIRKTDFIDLVSENKRDYVIFPFFSNFFHFFPFFSIFFQFFPIFSNFSNFFQFFTIFLYNFSNN